jgi:dTDP-4-dehydrorhamnose 3,5-epimerase-like enzyme
MNLERPGLLHGGCSVDDRGTVAFVNDFVLSRYRRMYIVTNHKAGFVRAWHGHKSERKAALVLSGAALVCTVAIDNWDEPSSKLPIQRFVLSERNPGVLEIPAGYANGFMSLSPDTRVAFFSSATLDESLVDDVRFPSRLWDPWSVEER